jgi:hypothetical protein
VPTHDQGSIDLVERYAIRRCHMGTDNNSTTISSPSALRENVAFKGGGHVRVLP